MAEVNELEIRIALLELAHANVQTMLTDLTKAQKDFQADQRKANGRVVGWLVASCFALTNASVLLAMNLAK